MGTIRAQKYEKNQDCPSGIEFSSENEYVKRATHQGPFFGGEVWRSSLNFTNEIFPSIWSFSWSETEHLQQDFEARKSLSIAKNQTEAFPSMGLFLNNSGFLLPPQRRVLLERGHLKNIHPNFIQNLGRQILGKTAFSVSVKNRMFSEKASAIARMRQKCVRNASKMRQKCVKMGLVLLGKEIGNEEHSKMRQKCVKIGSKRRQKCAEHLWWRTPFGRYRFSSLERLFFFQDLGPRGFWRFQVCDSMNSSLDAVHDSVLLVAHPGPRGHRKHL